MLHLGLLSKHALFNSQTKHRKSIQTKEKTLSLRVCKISFLPIALLWPVCSQWGFFPSYKSYLSFQTLPFPRKPFGQPFQFLFNKWSSLKLSLLQEQFWEKQMTLHTLKNPRLSNGMCRYHTMMLKGVLQIAERQNKQPPGLQGKPVSEKIKKKIVLSWSESYIFIDFFSCYFFFNFF